MRPYLAILSTVAILFALPGVAAIAPADAARAQSAPLRAKHAELSASLAASPFGKPLHLAASEERQRVSGDAFAVLDHPFARAADALSDPVQWCEMLLLPFNTKGCDASGSAGDSLALTIHVGRKYSTALENTHRLEFRFEPPVRGDDFLRVVLSAPAGPFGTRDYRIVLELTPLDDRRTFLHFGYAYAYGTLARAAMQTYLSTIASGKVGFTTEGTDENGKPALVRGMRAVMERNTMRYYLAIEAYLGAQRLAPRERRMRMVEDWFTAVERYPRQLHELERSEYVPMKLREFERMQAAVVSPAPRTASSSPSRS
jgi:hypothetical protein